MMTTNDKLSWISAFTTLLAVALFSHTTGLAGDNATLNERLIKAASRCDLEAVRSLLIAGADANARNADGSTALIALARENPAIWQRRDKKWRFYVSDKKAVHKAVENRLAIVELLIKNGAEVNARGWKGTTALIEAAKEERLGRIVAHLQSRGRYGAESTPGAKDAARLSRLALVKLLIRKRASIDQKDAADCTALMRAAAMNHLSVAKVLLNNGADVNAKDVRGVSVLMKAIRPGYVRLARLLLHRGADVNTKDSLGNTVLILAAAYGDYELARLLLERGASLRGSATGSSGLPVLPYAVRAGDTRTVRLLLSAGANIDAQTESGRTALMQAVLKGSVVMVKILLNRGADVELKDSWGRTAATLAKDLNNLEIRELLSSHGPIGGRETGKLKP
ncbi:ankyrin repeat domain-containing protein [Thermodesulfobacteriota bacterium]